MSFLQLLALTSALLMGAAAKSNNNKTIWAAVAFINNGETTPLSSDLPTVLSPEGATQMYQQGSAFRARYVQDGASDSKYQSIEQAVVRGLGQHAIDNDVLSIYSVADDWVSTGALAFMQGLYPPSPKTFADRIGADSLSQDYASGGSNVTDYPLDGYQYPNVHTPSYMDPNSAYIQGTSQCLKWAEQPTDILSENGQLVDLYHSTLSFYRNLFSSEPLKGTFSLSEANLWSAYDIYDYVSYMYAHNKTVYEGLNNMKNASTVLKLLNTYALSVEQARNSNVTSDSNDEKNQVLTIAGRTLASKILNQLVHNLEWNAERYKMTLLFGSHEPMISFISLSGLLANTDNFTGPFYKMPEPGAAMIFELYGEEAGSEDGPSNNDLYVRMYYRATTDPREEFAVQPLFGSDPSNGRIAFSDFMDYMQGFSVTPTDWCSVCGTTSATWCPESDLEGVNNDGSSSSSGKSKSMSPAVAGVIGAAVMLGILGVVFAALVVFAGLRLRRDGAGQNTNSPVGGFKSSEKKEEDRDVAVGSGGVRHERVGSWELRNATTIPPLDTGVMAKETGREAQKSMDEDARSVFGATPVKEHESV